MAAASLSQLVLLCVLGVTSSLHTALAGFITKQEELLIG
jgi:hypothetical protein